MTNQSDIAVVSISGAFPGSSSVEDFFQRSLSGIVSSREAAEGAWVLGADFKAQAPLARDAYRHRVGFFLDALPTQEPYSGEQAAVLQNLDPLFTMVCTKGAEALYSCRYEQLNADRVGVIMGNIALPTEASARFAQEFLAANMASRHHYHNAKLTTDPKNYHLTALPAYMLAELLGIGGPVFTLDAACASTLYALKLACDELREGRADMMITGGVAMPDSLYTQMGFSQLGALSVSGVARPFDQRADGLLVGEGCGFFALKRLADAVDHGDQIWGVVKGIGLSSDLEGGLLAPSSEGQLRAMRQAYANAGLKPQDIDYIECHATGTPLGDAVEVASLKELWGQGEGQCVLSSVKANVGHMLTAAGAAGLARVLWALKAKTLPPLASFAAAADALKLAKSPFRILSHPEAWRQAGATDGTQGDEAGGAAAAAGDPTPRRAAISGFGFGGINAHVIIEEYLPPAAGEAPQVAGPTPPPQEAPSAAGSPAANGVGNPQEVVVVGLGNYAGASPQVLHYGLEDVVAQFSQPRLHTLAAVAIAVEDFRIPPVEIKETLPQHLALLRAVKHAMDDAALPPQAREAAGAFVGIQLDPTANYYHARWQLLADGMPASDADDLWPALNANRVMGSLGGICGSRVAREWRLGGCGYTLSAEENSGLAALKVAKDALARGEISMAIVGAVDLVTQPMAVMSPGAVGQAELQDCAVAMVLMTKAQAEAEGRPYYAQLDAVMMGQHAGVGAALQAGLADFPQEELQYHCPDAAQDSIYYRGAASGLAALGRSFVEAKGPLVLGNRAFGGGEVYVAARRGSKTYQPPSATSQQNWLQVPVGRRETRASSEGALQPLVAATRDVFAEPFAHRTYGLASQPAAISPFPGGPNSGASEVAAVFMREPFADAVASETAPLAAAAARMGDHQEVGNDPEVAEPLDEVARVSGAGWQRAFQAALRQEVQTAAAYMGFSQQAFANSATLLERLVASVGHDRVTTVPVSGSDAAAVPLVPPASSQTAPDLAGANPKAAAALSQTPADHAPDFATICRARDETAWLNYNQCREFARGSIGQALGPRFAPVDQYPTRVRLPDEPLLLCHRIMGIKATPLSMGKGQLTTEHDIHPDAWYLDDQRIPVCIAVEAGQADLFLSAYLGVDFVTKGLRVYRLLDAVVCFHDELPGPEATITYDIHIDEFFRQGETLLFRFRFEASVGGKKLLTMSEGCAGFFTAQELAEGRGIIHTPFQRQEMPGQVTGGFSYPVTITEPISLSAGALATLRSGDYQGAFGGGFQPAYWPQDPKGLPQAPMNLVHRITHLATTGGRFGLGMVVGEADIHPDDWFITCHFVDDEVMPGTLMFECCLHTLRVFLMRTGWIGSRSQLQTTPVPGQPSRLKCRGQVLADTKVVRYQITIKEIGYQPDAYVICDALMFADDQPIVEITDMSLVHPGYRQEDVAKLWPQDGGQTAPGSFNGAQLAAIASGTMSDAFPAYRAWEDQGLRIPRLPRDPYKFLDHVTGYNLPTMVMAPGGKLLGHYHVPEAAWYLQDEGPRGVMPFSVLLEIPLQACGFMSTAMGSAMQVPHEVVYRNLGGQGRWLRDLTGGEDLVSEITGTKVAASGGLIIQNFAFVTRDRAGVVYEGTTEFGFFSHEAMAQQVGIRGAAQHDPAGAPTIPWQAYPTGQAYPKGALLMLDEVAFWEQAGREGMGFAKGRKVVDRAEWFFAAHFYEDPVMPGSLGLEAMVQLEKFVAGVWLPEAKGFRVAQPQQAHEWQYRGQVVQSAQVMEVELHVTKWDPDTRTLGCDGLLTVDGLVIYKMTNFMIEVLV